MSTWGSEPRIRAVAVIVVGVVGLLALAGLAVAKPRPLAALPAEEACPIAHVRLGVSYHCDVEFSLRASNGYRITVVGEVGAGRGTPDDVTLSASRGDATISYLGHGRLTSTHMTATFGRFGRFSLRFRKSGKVRRVRVPGSCVKDRAPVVTARLGTYVGTIRFEGEGAYSRVLAHRAAGGLGDPLAIKPRLECEGDSPAARRREARAIRLSAGAKTPDGSLSFGAWAGPAYPFKTSRGDPYIFLATASERASGVAVFRIAATTAPAADFVFDDALDSATLAPPAPFSGSATFQRNADGTIGWTGSLAVSFPGMPDIPLVGPQFRSSLSSGISAGGSR